MPDDAHDREVEEEWGRIVPERTAGARRGTERVARTAAAVEGLLLIAAVAVVLLVVGIVTGGVGWTLAGTALLVVLVGGLVALRVEHRDLEGRRVPLRRR